MCRLDEDKRADFDPQKWFFKNSEDVLEETFAMRPQTLRPHRKLICDDEREFIEAFL